MSCVFISGKITNRVKSNQILTVAEVNKFEKAVHAIIKDSKKNTSLSSSSPSSSQSFDPMTVIARNQPKREQPPIQAQAQEPEQPQEQVQKANPFKAILKGAVSSTWDVKGMESKFIIHTCGHNSYPSVPFIVIHYSYAQLYLNLHAIHYTHYTNMLFYLYIIHFVYTHIHYTHIYIRYTNSFLLCCTIHYTHYTIHYMYTHKYVDMDSAEYYAALNERNKEMQRQRRASGEQVHIYE